jgi:hypothetical protein
MTFCSDLPGAAVQKVTVHRIHDHMQQYVCAQSGRFITLRSPMLPTYLICWQHAVRVLFLNISGNVSLYVVKFS